MPDQSLRILLMGLMAAGKSTVGLALARRLGVRYLDNDALLAAQEGVDTLTLSLRGPSVLHAAESKQLRELARRAGSFVASAAASLGDRADDCAFAADHFVTVYLHVDPEVLAERVGRDPKRPFLSDDALAVESAMYATRDPQFRSKAAMVIDASQSVDTLVAAIVAALPDRG